MGKGSAPRPAEPPPQFERLLTPAELGVLLGGVAEKTLANWRYTMDGPRFVRLGAKGRGGRIAYDPADVRTWLETKKLSSTSDVR